MKFSTIHNGKYFTYLTAREINVFRIIRTNTFPNQFIAKSKVFVLIMKNDGFFIVMEHKIIINCRSLKIIKTILFKH
jgi:hypothetical protein